MIRCDGCDDLSISYLEICHVDPRTFGDAKCASAEWLGAFSYNTMVTMQFNKAQESLEEDEDEDSNR